MRKAFISAMSLLFAATLQSQVTTSFVFARQFGGPLNEFGRSVVVHPVTGDIFIIGYFSGAGDFDPGPGVMTLTSLGGDDMFIAKLDASGILVWVKRIGGTMADHGMDIDVDPLGNVFATGYFSGLVDFDPNAGIFNLTSFNNSPDAFILRLDPAGNFLSAGQMGGTMDDHAFKAVYDPLTGRFIITGWFNGIADFDPGAGASNLTSMGNDDIFIAGFNAMGNFNFARQMGGPLLDNAYDVAVDPLGNIYTTGSFSGTGDFDPGAGVFNLISAGQWDIFLTKLDQMGNHIWSRSVGGTDFDTGYSLAVDASGTVYITGFFQGNVDFDPGAGAFNLSATALSSDAFVWKMDASGNFVWVKQLVSPNVDVGLGIALDVFGNPYVTGYFFGTTDFDPGPGTFNITSNGSTQDIFLLRLVADGTFSWALPVGGAGSDIGFGIDLDQFGSIYNTGNFSNTADFNPGTGVFNMTAVGGTDAYLLKLNQGGQLPLTMLNFGGTVKDQQVHLFWQTVFEQNTSHFEIERSADGVNFKKLGQISAAGHSTDQRNYSYLDARPLTNTNFYRLRLLDLDGKISYSNIVLLRNSSPLFTVYPNPVKDVLSVQAKGQGPAVLRLIDAIGRTIKEVRIQLEGSTIHSFRINQIPNGLYYLVLDTGSEIQKLKFIKE